MSTRSIVTSQPDVACEVCERRLLRGEQPDVFIVAGERRIVCELCAPRAAQEGWMRESDGQPVTLPPMRPRRGRSFLERLRQVGRPAPERDAQEPSPQQAPAEVQPFDFMEAPATAEPVPASPRRRITGPRTSAPAALDGRDGAWDAGVAAEEGGGPGLAGTEGGAPSYPTQAVAVFNASEFPRRVAGVARSLGPPEVSVRSAEHLDSVVRIVVAWELCWYRYEVDLSDGAGEACLIGQGTELSELEREDRLANALAGEQGALALA